jgi:hypothetical protein
MNTVLVATSCLTNALLGGKRYEMLSSRSYRCNWVVMVALLDLIFGQEHCQDCFEFELKYFCRVETWRK